MRDLATLLPRIGAQQADRRNRILSALNGWTVMDHVCEARIVVPPETLSGWIALSNGAAIGLDRWRRQPCPRLGADGVAAAEWIDRFEPVLLLIERALGIELDPDRIGPAPQSDGLSVEIRLVDPAGVVVDRLWLLLPDELDLMASPAPYAPLLAAHIAVPTLLHWSGPRLSPVDAASLAPGDLLLLGSAPFDAVLDVDGVAQQRGRFDPTARCFTPATQPLSMQPMESEHGG